MMQDDPVANSAVEAVRCMFLARVLEKRGFSKAARHWEARAGGWLKKAEGGRDAPLVETDQVD